jgi:hypothetical protein
MLSDTNTLAFEAKSLITPKKSFITNRQMQAPGANAIQTFFFVNEDAEK